MKTIEISINRPVVRYSIEIGENILGNLPTMIKGKMGLRDPLPKILLITHLNLNTLYGQKLAKYLTDEGFKVHTECINTGESIKSWATAEKLLQKMIELEMNRSSIIIALGGGVIGDLSGFVSSVYNRGTRFIQVPTSLLAMVDASVGGKVAVNLGLVGKNLIGSFHQPNFVLTDLGTLKSLPEVEWKNGLSEVIKCAFLKEDRGSFYNWLIDNRSAITGRTDMEIIEHMVSESVRTKAQLVSRDEQEKSGLRMLLNLGHTFGHSLEASSRYRIAHGEAVAIGITLAARLAVKMGRTPQNICDQVINIVKAFGLAHHIDKKHGFSANELIKQFRYDKKNEGEIVRFIVPSGPVIGHCEVVHGVKEEMLREVFEEATF